MMSGLLASMLYGKHEAGHAGERVCATRIDLSVIHKLPSKVRVGATYKSK